MEDHDTPVKKLQKAIEDMWRNCPSQRMKRTLASDFPGFCFFGDNVGIIIKY